MQSPALAAPLNPYASILIAAVCLFVVSVATPVQAAGELAPYTNSTPTPAFSLPDIKGEVHDLVNYRGKVVLVNFWATWCPPCIMEMPSLQRLQAKLADRPFETLAVNVGEKRYRVRKFTKLVNFNLPVLLDEHNRTFDAWEGSVLPTSFLLDSHGRIRYWVVADLEWDAPEVLSVIEELLAETASGSDENLGTSD